MVVIEHNLEVVKTADWIIDMGPEGGDGGGEVVAMGPPEAIIRNPRSHTGAICAPRWPAGRRARRARRRRSSAPPLSQRERGRG